MKEYAMIWYKEIAILILAAGLFISLIKISRLRKALRDQGRKNLMPVLMLDIEPGRPGIFLKNEGDCYAKDIKVADIGCIVDLEFKKSLILKFERVGFLKPREKVRLDYRIFDGHYELPAGEADSLSLHLYRAEFECRIDCYNIENDRYTITLLKDKEGFHIKQVLPCRE